MSESLLGEIVRRRSQITVLAFNDVKARYKNSALGFLWTFLEPLLMLAVLYFVFTNIFRSEIQFYPLYLLLGLIMWYMFSRATTASATCFLDKSAIVTTVYFRREIIVISSCLASFIMMAFEFAAFGVFVAVFQFVPPPTAALFPPLLIALFALSVGVSLILSVMNVYFRDVQFIWQILLQAGFFLSPILYDLSMFPDNVRTILQLNPMATMLNVAHDMVLYAKLPTPDAALYIAGSTAAVLAAGYAVFRIKGKRLVENL